jgi:tripartite-type tricarboxylate transporter receptor subunit TctC
VIVTFAPGGAPDVLARAVAAQIETQIGQTLIIDNRAGANGVIGTQAVANAAPDGYTLLHASASFVVNPSVYKKLPYDSLKDITPISVVGATPFVLVVNPTKLPAKNAKDCRRCSRPSRAATTTPPRATARSSISPAKCSSTPPT